MGGKWHVDTALEIPERLLPPISEFDGYWNRKAQQARKNRAEELRRRPGRSSGSGRDQRSPIVETRPNLMLGATNGAISGDIHVVTSDGLLRQAILVAEGCNGSINLRIHAPSVQPLRVFASATNGSINIKVPSSFEGAVIMSTSWGNVNISDAIKAKLTIFSSTSNKSYSFVGNWQLLGFGSASNPIDPYDDPPLPGPQDPFAAWSGPLIDMSSTNGAVSLSYIEDDVASAYANHFTRAMQGFMGGWFSRRGQDVSMNGGSQFPASPMFHAPRPPVFHPSPPTMLHSPPPGTWPTHPTSLARSVGVGVLDLD